MEATAVGRGGYVNFGNCIKIWPVPAVDTTYTVEMAVAIPSLVDLAQLEMNWIARYHAQVYQRGLLAEAAGYLQDKEGYMTWQTLFEASLDKLAGQGWDEEIADAPRIHTA